MSEMQGKEHKKGKVRLSVLICTLPSRFDNLKKLMGVLGDHEGCEVIYLGDNKHRSVGRKRNDLLALAQGDYVSFVDDDDWVEPDYVPLLLRGIKSGVDVINFKVKCSVNGGAYKEVVYDALFLADRDTPERYERLPNHLMCIKRELAIKVGFKDMGMGEDADFAKRLKPHLRSEASIDRVLYYYNFSHQTSETQ